MMRERRRLRLDAAGRTQPRASYKEAAMPAVDERIYLLGRERQCREMARCARDPAIRHIHIAMANIYARRAMEADRRDRGYRVPV